MLSTVDGISVISNTLGRLTTTRHTRGHTRDQRLYFFSVLFFFHKPNIINPTSIQHSTPIQHPSNTLDRLIVPHGAHEVRGCTFFSSFLFSPTKHYKSNINPTFNTHPTPIQHVRRRFSKYITIADVVSGTCVNEIAHELVVILLL